MFQSLELGRAVDKQAYKQELPALREALLKAHHELAGAPFSVVVVMCGVEGSGKTEVLNHLLEWMDARGLEVHALDEPTDEERQRPPMWQFWRQLPARGRLAFFLDSWYVMYFQDAMRKSLSRSKLDQHLQRIVDFETMLRHENTLLVKFFLHLSRADQKARLKALKADPLQRWRVTKQDIRIMKRYNKIHAAVEYVLQRTSTALAPWTLVEAADPNYRNLTVGKTLLNCLSNQLQAPLIASVSAPPPLPPADGKSILQHLDLSQSLDDEEYEKKLEKCQAELGFWARKLHKKKRSMILVFEGPDAAGKGGAIRRLTAFLDARDYRVIAVSAPSDEERARPYLWRFWQHLPRQGRITIYDRSWYGRVLVERIEGFCAPADWQRAYAEINAFELQLTDFGIIVMKFWLAISPKEQLRRFQSRRGTPYKQYKLTEDDWRNRAKWDAYEQAAGDMIEKTGNEWAPWVLVEADNKESARIKVLHTVLQRLKREL